MYYCQNAHYFAGHGTNAANHLCQGMNRFPKPDGDGNITQVQQIIAGQQDAVYKQGQLFISMQQVQNIAFSIPVKDQSHMYGYKPGNKQVYDIRQRVHISRFNILTTLCTTKLIRNFKLSIISENIYYSIGKGREA
jgi:hypothetical protein